MARLQTHEFGVAEMLEQITEIPVQGVEDAVETVRNWSNDKVFQIGVHTMCGHLSPVEAGKALSNVAKASIAAVLSAVEEEFTGRHTGGGIAAVVLGDMASGEVAPGAELDVVFVYVGVPRAPMNPCAASSPMRFARCRATTGPPSTHESLCRKFSDALRALSRDNLLFAAIPDDRQARSVRRRWRPRPRCGGARDPTVTGANRQIVLETTSIIGIFVDNAALRRIQTMAYDAFGSEYPNRRRMARETPDAMNSQVETPVCATMVVWSARVVPPECRS